MNFENLLVIIWYIKIASNAKVEVEPFFNDSSKMILKKIGKKRTKSDDRLEYTISVRSTAIFKYDKVVI